MRMSKGSIETAKVRIGLIGCGGWGKNVARNLSELGVLAAIADPSEFARELAEEYHVDYVTDAASLLTDVTISAMAIAAPAKLHHQLTKQAFAAGKVADLFGAFWQVETERCTRSIKQVIFVDAEFTAKFSGLRIADNPFVPFVEEGPDDVPISFIAQYFFGHVANTFPVAVILDNDAAIFQHSKSLDEPFVEFNAVFSNHDESIFCGLKYSTIRSQT